MDTTRYDVVYDLLRSGYADWYIPLIGLLFVTIGLFARRSAVRRTRIVGWLFIVCASLWTVAALALTGGAYLAVRSAYMKGHYQVAEGTVRNFVPGDPGDHGEEQWDVASSGKVYTFRYSPSMMRPGYRLTRPHGGRVCEGAQVRVAAVGRDIVRLEVARGTKCERGATGP